MPFFLLMRRFCLFVVVFCLFLTFTSKLEIHLRVLRLQIGDLETVDIDNLTVPVSVTQR